MREDMIRVICEPARYRSRSKFPHSRAAGRKAIRAHALEELPTKESMSPKRSLWYNDHDPCINFNPLHRYLERSVGRLWDDVASEIRTAPHQRKFMDKLYGYSLLEYAGVTTRTTLVGGKVFTLYEHCSLGERELFNGDLYVHPNTGILSKYSRRTRKPKRKKYRSIRISETVYLRRIERVWYEYTLEWARGKWCGYGYSYGWVGLTGPVFLPTDLVESIKDEYRRRSYDVHCSKKRQLSKRDLRKHKLGRWG